MKLAVAMICFSVSFVAFANEYDDCVLAGLKGVSSDTSARLVAQACKNKVNEAKKSRRSSFGTDLAADDYSFNPSEAAQRHDDGLVSVQITNRASQKTITYVALTIKDGDYYDFKRNAKSSAKGTGQYDPFDGVLGSSEWENNRTHVYYYKLSLKPGKTIRLKFPLPKIGTLYSELTTILGRESKWADTVQQFKDEINPESKDPLE